MNATRDTAVVLTCDAGYLPYALCLAERLAALHPGRGFDILVFTEAPVEPPRGFGVPDLQVIAPPPNNPFAALGGRSRHGLATYHRLLVPREVAGKYRRLLYLDCDVLPMGDGLDRLLGLDLGGLAVGAVRDHQQWRAPGRRVEEFRRAKLSAAPYLNAGVLLIDVAAFNDQRVLERSLDLMERRPDLLGRNDQSLLNLVLYGAWAELSPVWNWQHTRSTRFFTALAEPRLLHFIGPRKPWRDERAQLPASYRDAYRSFLRRCYPDRPELVTADERQMAWPDRMVPSLLRHALGAAATRRYLDAFPDPWVVRTPAAAPS